MHYAKALTDNFLATEQLKELKQDRKQEEAYPTSTGTAVNWLPWEFY